MYLFAIWCHPFKCAYEGQKCSAWMLNIYYFKGKNVVFTVKCGLWYAWILVIIIGYDFDDDKWLIFYDDTFMKCYIFIIS